MATVQELVTQFVTHNLATCAQPRNRYLVGTLQDVVCNYTAALIVREPVDLDDRTIVISARLMSPQFWDEIGVHILIVNALLSRGLCTDSLLPSYAVYQVGPALHVVTRAPVHPRPLSQAPTGHAIRMAVFNIFATLIVLEREFDFHHNNLTFDKVICDKVGNTWLTDFSHASYQIGGNYVDQHTPAQQYFGGIYTSTGAQDVFSFFSQPYLSPQLVDPIKMFTRQFVCDVNGWGDFVHVTTPFTGMDIYANLTELENRAPAHHRQRIHAENCRILRLFTIEKLIDYFPAKTRRRIHVQVDRYYMASKLRPFITDALVRIDAGCNPGSTPLLQSMCQFAQAYAFSPTKASITLNAHLVTNRPVLANGKSGMLLDSGSFMGTALVTKVNFEPRDTIFEIAVNFLVINALLLAGKCSATLVPTFGVFQCGSETNITFDAHSRVTPTSTWSLCQTPGDTLYMVQSKIEGQPLDATIDTIQQGTLKHIVAKVIATLVIMERTYNLHHNDLHLNNIMLDPARDPHIIDFGRASYTYHGIHVNLDTWGTASAFLGETIGGVNDVHRFISCVINTTRTAHTRAYYTQILDFMPMFVSGFENGAFITGFGTRDVVSLGDTLELVRNDLETVRHPHRDMINARNLSIAKLLTVEHIVENYFPRDLRTKVRGYVTLYDQ